jgi:hypothetical protein
MKFREGPRIIKMLHSDVGMQTALSSALCPLISRIGERHKLYGVHGDLRDYPKRQEKPRVAVVPEADRQQVL